MVAARSRSDAPAERGADIRIGTPRTR